METLLTMTTLTILGAFYYADEISEFFSSMRRISR